MPVMNEHELRRIEHRALSATKDELGADEFARYMTPEKVLQLVNELRKARFELSREQGKTRILKRKLNQHFAVAAGIQAMRMG